MILNVLFLILGVYACSTAVIMIKVSTMDPVLLSALRLLIAAAALTPLAWRDLRRHRGRFGLRDLRATLLPGLLLGLHFVSWIIGARQTPAVNASLIVNMVPIVMPLLMFVLVRERLTAGELAGTAISLAGLALLAATDFDLNPRHFLGDMTCFVSMLLFAFYLALGRRNRSFATIWLYVVPLYYAAGLLCLAAAVVLRADIFQPYPLKEVLLVLGLALIPTVVGHSILNYSMKHLRGQVVSVLNLGQFVFAGTMGYFFFGDVPHWALYVAAACLVAGAIIVLRSQEKA